MPSYAIGRSTPAPHVAPIRHLLAILAIPLVLVLVTGLGIAAGTSSPRHGPVYTVGQLHALLTRDPGIWADMTVQVRGVAEPCLTSGSPARFLFCRRWRHDLLYPDPGAASDALPLAWGTRPSWLALLRGVPVLGALLPPVQSPHWAADATYRVQLRAVPTRSCIALPCYEAVLLDAGPGPLGKG